jgi:hypothetical protein
MIRQTVAMILAVAMAAPAWTAGKPTIEERVLGIPIGSVVEVKLRGNQQPNKLVGRIGEATADGVRIQVMKDEKVQDTEVAFANMKSVKTLATPGQTVNQCGSTAAYVVVGALAAVGVLFGLAFGGG